MKRHIKITASFSGVIPTGPYQNSRPGFGVEEEFEIEFENEAELNQKISLRQSEIQDICNQSFQVEVEKGRIAVVKNSLKNFRFYPSPRGEEMPSVTSIIGYDKDWFNITDADLEIYAAQGNLIDAEFKNFVKTGVYKSSSELPQCAPDRFIIKSRTLSTGKKLALSGWDIQAFLKKYPITNMRACETGVFNYKHRYAGTPDIVGELNGLKTLVSIKRTKSETENFIQDSAYANCEGMEDVKQIIICPFKAPDDGGPKQGFSEPSITTDIPRYFELFLAKRAEFKKVFGI